MIVILLAVSLAALAVGLVLRRRAQEQLAELSVAGDVVYADNGEDEVLVSRLQGLAGKPDYVRKEGDGFIPVERKSRLLSTSGAHEGEILQLAAYACWLRNGSAGLWRATIRTDRLDVPFDDQLRGTLLDALPALRAAGQLEDLGRSPQ